MAQVPSAECARQPSRGYGWAISLIVLGLGLVAATADTSSVVLRTLPFVDGQARKVFADVDPIDEVFEDPVDSIEVLALEHRVKQLRSQAQVRAQQLRYVTAVVVAVPFGVIVFATSFCCCYCCSCRHHHKKWCQP
eukprot:TRINITY_DN34323_c0_g1_i1.p2 TRINITY_DN34323_c0_g1~~TRINITY_DN34323_c0_g1_i1.p2  ORF type:complete len:136 (-),score=17.41 TRINITY_DN34323_c0_g1_i1:618-1025(-)